MSPHLTTLASQLGTIREELETLRLRNQLADELAPLASCLAGSVEQRLPVLLHTYCCLAGRQLSTLVDALDGLTGPGAALAEVAGESQEVAGEAPRSGVFLTSGAATLLQTYAVLARFRALECFDGLSMGRRSLAAAGLPGLSPDPSAVSHVRMALELELRSVVEAITAVLAALRRAGVDAGAVGDADIALDDDAPRSGVVSLADDDDDDEFTQGSRIVGVTRHRVTAFERVG